MEMKMDFKHMQATGERLLWQIMELRLLRDEITQAESKIKYMSYTEPVRAELVKSREALDANIRVLISMEKVMKESCAKYQRTEGRISDRYNLEMVVYPMTEFKTSYITGMEEHQALMPF